ncbi:MAG TPA: hypothetical protein VKR06_07930 [Ktedonosporobacter sp.]|nr:hypothetical protein [Ktedonosporobacter sp.]
MQCQGPNCAREIVQVPGSHRLRVYCSDRCRIAARRLHIRGGEQKQIQTEARARREREKVADRFGLLTEESLDLLVDLGQRDAKLALLVGQALARERDQALALQKRGEQEQVIQAEKARRLGADLGYPEVDALDLGEGEYHWRNYLANPKYRLEPLFAEIAKLTETIKTVTVELYLRVENNSKYVRGKGKVREDIERSILSQYSMEKHPNEVEYTLTIPYETDEQLERIIERDILQEADMAANARHCFIEADIRALDDTGRHW